MHGKLFFIIRIFVFKLVCFSQIFYSQPAPTANGGWDIPFQRCWALEIERAGSYAPVSDNRQTIFQTLSEGKLAAIDTVNGKIIWRSQFGGEIVSDAIFADGKLYLINKIVSDKDSEFVLRAVSAATGLTLWQKILTFSKETGRISLQVFNNSLLIVSSQTGQLKLVDKGAGIDIWHKDLKTEITTAPTLFENAVFFGTTENKILALAIESGEILYQLESKNAPTGNFSFAGGEILATGDRSGNISAFRLADRKLLWKTRAGAQIVDITPVAGNFLVSSNDGFVYFLSSKNGDRLWKKRLTGRFLGKPIIYNNLVLLQTIDGNSAVILDLNNGKLVNQIYFGEDLQSEGEALELNHRVIIPSNNGLLLFSTDCAEK